MMRATIRGVAAGLLVAVFVATPAAGAMLHGNGKIAFDRNVNHNWDIYVKQPARGTPALRLTTSAADDFAPSFSPDGARIAFTSDRLGNYDIYTMNSAGRDLRRITTNPGKDAFPSWSPDGRTLAFFQFDPSVDKLTARGRYPGSLCVMNTDGSARRSLVGGLKGHYHVGVNQFWSPAGDSVYFEAARLSRVSLETGKVDYPNSPVRCDRLNPDGSALSCGTSGESKPTTSEI